MHRVRSPACLRRARSGTHDAKRLSVCCQHNFCLLSLDAIVWAAGRPSTCHGGAMLEWRRLCWPSVEQFQSLAVLARRRRQYYRWQFSGQSQLDGVRSVSTFRKVDQDLAESVPRILNRALAVLPPILVFWSSLSSSVYLLLWHSYWTICSRFWDDIEQKWVTANDPGTSVSPLCSGEWEDRSNVQMRA